MERKKVKVQLKRNGAVIEVNEGGSTHQAAINGKGAWQLPGAAPLPKNAPQQRQASAPATPKKKRSVEPAGDNTIPVPPAPTESPMDKLEPKRAEFGKFPTREEVQRPAATGDSVPQPIGATAAISKVSTEPKPPETLAAEPKKQSVKTNRTGGQNAKG